MNLKQSQNSAFEKIYIQLRKQELRVYTDDEALTLPVIHKSHPHHQEWIIRKRSTDRLMRYLKKKQHPLKILEIGCGNGWLSARLSTIQNTHVTGIDINQQELEQAKRIFSNIKNLKFIFGELNAVNNLHFDIILFAASIQYFSPLSEIINSTLKMLTSNGEIHLIDTPFYSANEIAKARKRSVDYFITMNCVAMSGNYHHHNYRELEEYNVKMLHSPKKYSRFLPGVYNPFPWICIKQLNHDPD